MTESIALLFLALALAYAIVEALFARYLKRVHREVWVSLGGPSILNRSIANSWKLGRFLFFSREFQKLNDNRVRTYVVILRVLMAAVTAILVAAFAFEVAGSPWMQKSV